ncbi:MAG TPA: 2,4'-dihydroxyacetophenone dioxygenase family protein, partial [Methylomirabilota bacterium]|nr:2,4'-dihydroxyacetophenone dioxygenase family protein [Methylomirabilota bacterium]
MAAVMPRPYQLPQPPDMRPDFVVKAIPDDERIWVPLEEHVWFRPLHLNVTQGFWCNLLRVRRAGVLSRHRHPAPVYGYVIKGSWRYLEHGWTAEEGSFVYEPPGETHTLVVEPHVPEMITFFQVNGAMIYVDEQGKAVGYDDVHTRVALCRRYYETVGLG